MKKIISILTSVVLAFSVVSSAVMADYTPTSGMPAVKTQLTNITFDNISVYNKSGTYTYYEEDIQ